MVTLLYPGKEFRITHQEMIKGMKKGTTGVNYRWVEENEPPRPLPSLPASHFLRVGAKGSSLKGSTTWPL